MRRGLNRWNVCLTATWLLFGTLGCGKGETPSDDPPTPGPAGSLDKKKGKEEPRPDDGGNAKIVLPKLDLEPDPKIAAEKKADEERQRDLEELCKKAMKEETRAEAIKGLDKRYPKLADDINTLAKDKTPADVKTALENVGKLGLSVKGTWPAVNGAVERMLRSDKSDAAGAVAVGLDTLTLIAPDSSAGLDTLVRVSKLPDVLDKKDAKKVLKDHRLLREVAVKALGKNAPGYPAGQARIVAALADTVNDPTIAESAVKTLGEVARACPAIRGDVVKVLDRALQDKDFNRSEALRRAAVDSLAPCGFAVDAKAKATLDHLRLDDESNQVRSAAAATLKEVDRQHLVVPQLRSVKIIEGTIKTPLYQAAFLLVEWEKEKKGENDKFEGARKALAEAPRDRFAWYTLARLTELQKQGEQDHVKTREAALKLLADWVSAEKDRREQGAVIFAAALHEPTTADAALVGLSHCGVHGVRQVRDTKAKVNVFPTFRGWLRQTDAEVRTAAVDALASLKTKSERGLELLIELLDPKEPAALTRTAAEGLLHIGPEHWALGRAIRNQLPKLDDRKTEKILKQVLKNLGLDGSSETAFSLSLVLHPKVSAEVKESIYPKLNVAVFAKAAGAKPQEEYVAWWLKANKPSFTSKADGKATRQAYSKQLAEICQVFGVNAKELAPLLVKDLEDHNAEKPHMFDPLQAVQALAAIGPVPGVNLREALDRTYRKSFDPYARDAAKKALDKLK